jgi:hypothetical protein
MQSKSFQHRVAIGTILTLVLGVVVLFENCGIPKGENSPASSERLAEVNYFTEPRPDSLCGKAGYTFLHRQYFEKYCGGSCHVVGGSIGPAFGDEDINVAYYEQSFVHPNRMLLTSMNNQFCGPYCNLDTRGEVYQGILEWLGCR